MTVTTGEEGIIVNDHVWTIRMLYLIALIDHLGISMAVPLLSLFAFSLGASRTQAGFIVSVYGGLHIFSSPLMGKMSDNYGRKRIMLLCYTLPCLGYVLTGLSSSLIMLALSRIPNGLMEHGLSIAKAYIVDITDSSQRPSVMGYFEASSMIGSIVGPLVSGYLAFVDSSLTLSIYTGTVVLLFNLFIVSCFLPPSKKDQSLMLNQNVEDSQNNNIWSKVCKALDITRGINWWAMTDVLLIEAMTTMSMSIFYHNFPVYMERVFSVKNIALGELLSYISLVKALAFLACGVVARRCPYSFYEVSPSIVLLFVSLVLMAMASKIDHIVIGLFIFSISVSYFRVCLVNLLLKRAIGNNEGAILGLASSVGAICTVLAASLVGIVQEFGSRNNGYLAALFALTTIVGIFLSKCWTSKRGNEEVLPN